MLPEYRLIRNQRLSEANNICELCKKNKSTEVHHLVYPPWGEIDVIENMIAVCHPCHCRVHKKEK